MTLIWLWKAIPRRQLQLILCWTQLMRRIKCSLLEMHIINLFSERSPIPLFKQQPIIAPYLYISSALSSSIEFDLMQTRIYYEWSHGKLRAQQLGALSFSYLLPSACPSSAHVVICPGNGKNNVFRLSIRQLLVVSNQIKSVGGSLSSSRNELYSTRVDVPLIDILMSARGEECALYYIKSSKYEVTEITHLHKSRHMCYNNSTSWGEWGKK